jgi:hypothetical protein
LNTSKCQAHFSTKSNATDLEVTVASRPRGTMHFQAYPSLRAEDLTNAWSYYNAHKSEIEQQIAEHEAA